MRPALAVLGLGGLGVALQGALADLLPRAVVPELGLLAVVGAALVLGRGSGMAVAFLLGLGADLLSGALLGQQAALRLLAFAVTVGLGGSLDLGRGLPLAVFVFALVLGDGIALLGLTRLFLGPVPVSLGELEVLAGRAALTAALAPAAAGLFRGLVRRLAEGEARREMRLETRRPVF